MLPISNEHILTENLDFIKNPQKSKKKEWTNIEQPSSTTYNSLVFDGFFLQGSSF